MSLSLSSASGAGSVAHSSSLVDATAPPGTASVNGTAAASGATRIGSTYSNVSDAGPAPGATSTRALQLANERIDQLSAENARLQSELTNANDTVSALYITFVIEHLLNP